MSLAIKVQRGEWKGRKLRSPAGREIRPMGARLRCKVMDALSGCFEGALVYDICAGSGAQGIEALSLGAARAVFVDRSAAALTLVRQNVEQCSHEALAQIDLRRATADRVLEDLALEWQASAIKDDLIIFVSPPYETTQMICEQSCRAFAAMLRSRAHGLILVLQHPPRHDFDLPPLPGLPAFKKRTYTAGDSRATIFWCARSDADSAADSDAQAPQMEQDQ